MGVPPLEFCGVVEFGMESDVFAGAFGDAQAVSGRCRAAPGGMRLDVDERPRVAQALRLLMGLPWPSIWRDL